MGRPAGVTRIVTLLVSGIYSIVLWASGIQLPGLARFIVSILPTVVAALLVVWDLEFWRVPGVQRLTRRPDLRGLWHVTLTPHPDSAIPAGGNRGPIEAFMEVSQSYWSIHLRLYSEESSSKSTAASWLPTFENGVDGLTFTYLNTPETAVSHRSPRSAGACNLDTTSLKPQEIEGRYFTDRLTKGDMRLTFIDRKMGYPSFAAAKKHSESALENRTR